MKQKQKAVTLAEFQGLSQDMLEKLTGKNSQYWLWVYKKVSRKENPFEVPEDETERWKVFYLEFFGLEVDFSEVHIPEEKEGFSTVLFFPKGLTFDEIIHAYHRYVRTEEGERFSLHTSNPKSEQDLTFEGSLVDARSSKEASYAIRMSDSTWQSRFEGRKIVDLEKEGVKFLNPREYFLYDLYWMWMTGKGPVAAPNRLNNGTAILCGSKMQSGEKTPSYPCAHWDYHLDAYFKWDYAGSEAHTLNLVNNTGRKVDPVVIEVIT